MIAHCRASGIPLKVEANRFMNLLYMLLLVVLHQNDFGEGVLNGTFDLLLELITAYCLGEIENLPKELQA